MLKEKHFTTGILSPPQKIVETKDCSEIVRHAAGIQSLREMQRCRRCVSHVGYGYFWHVTLHQYMVTVEYPHSNTPTLGPPQNQHATGLGLACILLIKGVHGTLKNSVDFRLKIFWKVFKQTKQWSGDWVMTKIWISKHWSETRPIPVIWLVDLWLCSQYYLYCFSVTQTSVVRKSIKFKLQISSSWVHTTWPNMG